ncbi:uncharacterized protein LOC111253769 isoform X2 [Varroa destructor]|uniref:BTB domain-containing protein n=1 Tax=Varroa destructor TaxID=109461 RepID=A0A7M7KN49_VARDE|nr:uncharacterized protein LOC111253769 isoform X2 [Varroa destructor]
MMKQILQIKRRKIPAVPASSIASSKARSTQRTLHALFTCTPEQRDAANRQRLHALLTQKYGSPGRPPGENDGTNTIVTVGGNNPHHDNKNSNSNRLSTKDEDTGEAALLSTKRSMEGATVKETKGKSLQRISSSQNHGRPDQQRQTNEACINLSHPLNSAIYTPARRQKRDISFVDQVPRMYNLALGDDSNCSYVVPGFEEYVPHRGKQCSQRETTDRSSLQQQQQQQLEATNNKESENSTVKAGSNKESRSTSANQEKESRRKEGRQSKNSRVGSKEPEKDSSKDGDSKARERPKEKKEIAREVLSAAAVSDPKCSVKDVLKMSSAAGALVTTNDEEKKPSGKGSQNESSRDGQNGSGQHRQRNRDHCEHRGSKRKKNFSRTLDSGTGSLHDKDKPCTISVETIQVMERGTVIACQPTAPPTSSVSPPFAKKPCVMVSPTATEATAVTSTSTSDQRLPDNREISALREIVTNYQVPSIVGGLPDKSPSCTPTHSVVAPLPADLDRRVLDWVDNCVSQKNNNGQKEQVTAMTSSTNGNSSKKSSTRNTYDEGSLRDLQRSYLRLVDSEECSDLVIETEDRPIRAHKTILFVRCPKLTQTVSADSSFWQLSWCCSEAVLLFLRFLYAADVSFVASVEGRVRKDLLTLCCQYQTDELAARLIRERSPSPLPSQLQPAQMVQQHLGFVSRGASSATALLSRARGRKRCPSPSIRRRRVRLGSEISSENASDTGSSSGKKTRMSITCETVSVTAPTNDDRHRIQQSPRLPQPGVACTQHSTPLVTPISDDDDEDIITSNSHINQNQTTPVRTTASLPRIISGSDSKSGAGENRSTVANESANGRRGAGVPVSTTGGSADQPIDVGSSSDLFSDEDVVVGAIIQSQPPPLLSPIQPTPRRPPDEEEEIDGNLLPSPPAFLRSVSQRLSSQRLSPERKSASSAAHSHAPPSSVSSVMSSPSTSTRLLHRKSFSQPTPGHPLNDDDEDNDCNEEPDDLPNVAGLCEAVVSIGSSPTGSLSSPLGVSRVVDGLDVTPQPRFSMMKTPEMHAQLNQYGIKPSIGKRKAVQILKHIYQTTHPEISHPDDERPEGEEATGERNTYSSSSDDSDGDLPLEETMIHDDDEEISDNVEDKITRSVFHCTSFWNCRKSDTLTSAPQTL